MHPDAIDACDDVDNNCDGFVDGPVDLAVSMEGELEEGGSARFVASDPTCGHPVTLTLSGPRAGDCRGESCRWTDDGELTVQADAVSGADSRVFTVANVPPNVNENVCGCGCDPCPADFVGIPGERLVVTLATDVPVDNLLCSLSEPVPGLLLEGCVGTWDVSEGSWSVEVDAWDKEGEHTKQTITFAGDAENGACAPAGAWSGLGVLVGMWLAGRRAVRRVWWRLDARVCRPGRDLGDHRGRLRRRRTARVDRRAGVV